MYHSFFWWNYLQGRRAGTDIEKGLVDTESEGVCRTSRERIETYILWSESASQSCLTLCEPMDCSPPGSFCPLNSPGKNIRVGSHSLLQGIFPTKGSNPHFLHYRQILYHLNHQGSLHTHSVQFSHSVMSDSLRTHESQHARPPCPSPTPGYVKQRTSGNLLFLEVGNGVGGEGRFKRAGAYGCLWLIHVDVWQKPTR